MDILSHSEQWIAKYILNHRGATSRPKLMQALRKKHAVSFFHAFSTGHVVLATATGGTLPL